MDAERERAKQLIKQMNWTPLFSDLMQSSIWRCSPHIKLAWITILATKDYKSQIIETNPGLLGWAAGITEEQAAEALELFQQPDKYSRSAEEEGRRIKRLEGNKYLVINGYSYSQKIMSQAKKDADAARKAEAREAARLAAENNPAKAPDSKPQRNPAESCGILPKAADEAPTPFLNTPLVMESSAASKRFQKPSLDEVKLACAKCGLPENEAERFWNYYDSVGWKVGKNPMKSWTSALAGTWKSNWQERNQQQAALPKKKEISVFDSL